MKGADFVLHRRVGVDGRAEGGLGGADQLLLPYQVNAEGHAPRPGTRTPSSCTACRRSTTPRPRSASRCSRSTASRAWRSPTRFRVARVDRVRPGREPDAHDQGGARRHDRQLRIRDAHRRRPRWQRVAPAGQPMTAENQRQNVRVAAEALAPVAEPTSSSSPMATARRSGCSPCRRRRNGGRAYPLDVLGAQTEGMIGYLIEQELGNLLPFERPFASILTMVEVVPPIRPSRTPRSHRAGLRRARTPSGWRPTRAGRSRPTGTNGGEWSRPQTEADLPDGPIRWLLEHGAVVDVHGRRWYPHDVRAGYEAPDRCRGRGRQGPRERVARRAARRGLFVMATDVEAVFTGWGTPSRRPSPPPRRTSCRSRSCPLVDGAQGRSCGGVRSQDRQTGGHRDARQLRDVVGGTKGTQVVPQPAAMGGTRG